MAASRATTGIPSTVVLIEPLENINEGRGDPLSKRKKGKRENMNSLQQAMIAAGLASSTTVEPSDTHAKVEPCTDEVGRLCHYLVAILGSDRAAALVEEQLTAPYGKARRIEAIQSAVSRAEQSLPVKVVRAASERGSLSWGRSPNEAMEDVLDALTSGAYALWEAQQTAVVTTSWPSAPPAENLTKKVIEDYVSALYDWEGDYTPAQLRASGYPGYATIRDELTRLMQDQRASREASSARATYEGYMAHRVELAGMDWGSDLDAEVVESLIGVRVRASLSEICASSARGWEEPATWSSLCPPVAPPPQGWEAIHEKALLAAITLPSEDRRLPGAVPELFRRRGASSSQVVLTDRHVVHFSGRPSGNLTGITGVFATAPHPEGWYVANRNKVAGPEVYEALQRVRSHKQGTLSVEALMVEYGRHETKAFPRFRGSAYRSTCIIIGIDPALGAYLDDLALVLAYDCEIPTAAYWIDAHVTATAAGGLYLRAGARERTALVRIRSSEQSYGRFGRKGELVLPSKKNKSLAVAAQGGSAGGGQSAALIFAAVTSDTPLLLDNGSGVALTAEGTEIIPGLETNNG